MTEEQVVEKFRKMCGSSINPDNYSVLVDKIISALEVSKKSLGVCEKQKLKPCPFCGSDNVELHRNIEYVLCTKCGARGTPFDGHPADAVESWNRRAN